MQSWKNGKYVVLHLYHLKLVKQNCTSEILWRSFFSNRKSVITIRKIITKLNQCYTVIWVFWISFVKQCICDGVAYNATFNRS